MKGYLYLIKSAIMTLMFFIIFLIMAKLKYKKTANILAIIILINILVTFIVFFYLESNGIVFPLFFIIGLIMTVVVLRNKD